MNIVQINVFDRDGSTGRICTEMQQHINNKLEYRCCTAYARGTEKEKGYHIGSDIEHKFHALFARLTGRQGFFSKHETKKLLGYLDEIKPDVVHLHNLHSNYINLPVLLKYLAEKDIATVITLHDCWFYTGGCCHYTIDKCDKWKTGCKVCPRWHQDKSWLVDATEKNYRQKKSLLEKIPRLAVVGVSDWITDEARESFLSKAKILRRIYNWIDLKTFAFSDELRGTLLGKYNRKIVLSVSSFWTESKGITDFIRLAERLGDAYEVVLIGTMEYKGKLPYNIDAVGPVKNPKELAKYYSAADAFVNLSMQETFGKVSAEALACGTPVVCVDSTANREIVEDGCGIVLKEKNIDLMAESVISVCSRGYGAFRKECRQSAEKRFNMEKLIDEHIRVYDDLTSEPNSRRDIK